MHSIWQRIEAWLRSHAPALLGSLQEGATVDEIVSAERELGITFPEDLRSSLHIHNGQSSTGALLPGLIQGRLFSVEGIQREWRMLEDLRLRGDFDGISSWPEGPIKPDWWNPAWIPLTSTWSGDHQCLDMDPAKGGAVGQIIWVYHDDRLRWVKAPSFEAWLRGFADGLEDGTYVYGGADVGVVDKADL